MRMHVLEGDGNNVTIVVHAPVPPAGTNSAGFLWSQVLIAVGLNQSRLTVGLGPGQTTQAEMDSIIAGTTFEDVMVFGIGNLTGAALAAELDARATARVASSVADMQQRFKWYGQTRA